MPSSKAQRRPWKQSQASTIFLRVPVEDWVAVKRGMKTEFRMIGHGTSQMQHVKTPTPVVAYRVGRTEHAWEAVLMVLEETWQEALLAISPESLEREGFKEVAEFRRYWMRRTKARFRPTRMVRVFRVRPWRGEEDEREMGATLLRRLYGEHLAKA